MAVCEWWRSCCPCCRGCTISGLGHLAGAGGGHVGEARDTRPRNGFQPDVVGSLKHFTRFRRCAEFPSGLEFRRCDHNCAVWVLDLKGCYGPAFVRLALAVCGLAGDPLWLPGQQSPCQGSFAKSPVTLTMRVRKSPSGSSCGRLCCRLQVP
jgi:hypothetical protein